MFQFTQPRQVASRRRARLSLEALETRTLLSINPVEPTSFLDYSSQDVPNAVASVDVDLPPQVVSTGIARVAGLDGPPTGITVRFSEAIDLFALQRSGGQAAFLRGADGQRFAVQPQGYDPATHTITFTPFDRLPGGKYAFHLSGPGGLTDLGGLPLVGNDASGDYVLPFTVADHPPPPLQRVLTDADDAFDRPTDLGVLFPNELRQAVTVRRDFRAAAVAPRDEADYYRFTVLQSTEYVLELAGPDLSVGGRPALLNARGEAVTPPGEAGSPLRLRLPPGTYTIRVGGWQTGDAATAVYTLRISVARLEENPTPLPTAPAPGSRPRLAPSPAQPPAMTPPHAPAPPGEPLRLVLPSPPVVPVGVSFDPRPVAVPPPALSVPANLNLALATTPLGVVAPAAPTPEETQVARLALPDFGTLGETTLAAADQVLPVDEVDVLANVQDYLHLVLSYVIFSGIEGVILPTLETDLAPPEETSTLDAGATGDRDAASLALASAFLALGGAWSRDDAKARGGLTSPARRRRS